MALRFPRRLGLGFEQWLGRCGKLIALAGLGVVLIPAAEAQIIIGGHAGPAVTVDNSVLERLGPPRTLPQLFLAERGRSTTSRQVATTHRPIRRTATSRHTAKRKIAIRHRGTPSHRVARAARSRAKAPVRTASSLHRIIHLTRPGTRVASAKPAPAAPATHVDVRHEDMAVSAPTKPTAVALVAPAPTRAPAPKQPASSDVPTPPVQPQRAAREVSPPAPVEPPSQPVVARAPAAAPTPIVAAASTAAASVATPSVRVPSPSAPAMTVAAAPPPVAAPPAPPLQMAAATTAGNAATAIKFKPGVTDLGNGPEPALDAIARRLADNENLRVQLISHATGSSDEAMEARRVSLARAIAVRRYLIDKGVVSLRIDVRALGNHSDEGPATDQVDLLVVSQ